VHKKANDGKEQDQKLFKQLVHIDMQADRKKTDEKTARRDGKKISLCVSRKTEPRERRNLKLRHEAAALLFFPASQK